MNRPTFLTGITLMVAMAALAYLSMQAPRTPVVSHLAAFSGGQALAQRDVADVKVAWPAGRCVTFTDLQTGVANVVWCGEFLLVPSK